MAFEVAGRVVAPATVLGHKLAHDLGVRRPAIFFSNPNALHSQSIAAPAFR